ncbi:MAG: hypothetical protein ACE5JP_13980 [Candidatus Bipolaricaulia bacterium]
MYKFVRRGTRRAEAIPVRGIELYHPSDFNHLLIFRLSQIARERRYGRWKLRLSRRDIYYLETLAEGLTALIDSYRGSSTEEKPILKVDQEGDLYQVDRFNPIHERRLQDTAIIFNKRRDFEDLWLIGISFETDKQISGERSLYIVRTEKYLAPWYKGLNSLRDAMQDDF